MNIAILIRLYTQADQENYDGQLATLKALAKTNQWNIVRVITATKKQPAVHKQMTELFDLIRQKAIQKVVATNLTCLGLKAKEICELYEYLHTSGVSLYVHSLELDTSAFGMFQQAVNTFVTTLLTEIAEQETIILSQRSKAALKKAKDNGKTIGRPKGSKVDFYDQIENKAQYKSASWLLNRGISLRRTATLAGISINTVRKIKKAIKEPKG